VESFQNAHFVWIIRGWLVTKDLLQFVIFKSPISFFPQESFGIFLCWCILIELHSLFFSTFPPWKAGQRFSSFLRYRWFYSIFQQNQALASLHLSGELPLRGMFS
jgi:hypothetical protein